MSPLPQQQVNRPAPTDMRAGAAEVSENVAVPAARFFQRIGKHGQAGGVQSAGRQGSLLVGGGGEVTHGWGEPGGAWR